MKSKPVEIFIILADKYAFFRNLAWKPIYEFLAKLLNVDDWMFMNYGYVPSDTEKKLKLHKKDEINRYPIQLYDSLANYVKIKGLNVLEVGSGRGGGAIFLAEYHMPNKMIGMDIARNAVRFANRRNTQKNLEFIQGNAEKIPFDDNSFDIVINVESCHAYANESQFFKEVKRVLKPGGFFLCADARTKDRMGSFCTNVQNSGLEIIHEQDIVKNVIESIEKDDKAKRSRIEKSVPKLFQSLFNEFAGVMGSHLHESLLNGNMLYRRFIMRKGSNLTSLKN